MGESNGLVYIKCSKCRHDIGIDAEALKNWPLLRSARAYCPRCNEIVEVPGRLFAKKQ